MAEEKATDLIIDLPNKTDEIIVEAVYISDLSIAVKPDVETLPHGDKAKVQNLGNSKNAVLKFSIPEGKPGKKGEKGDKGDPGVSDWNDLENKPIIPSKTSDLVNDSGFITALPGEIITESELDIALQDKQDSLIAGDNITISGNVISAKGGASEANEVSYDNPDYPTVQAALDKLLYVAPKIEEFKGGNTYEIGSVITKVNLSWKLNKKITSQSINQGIGSLDPDLRAYTHENRNITTNTRYTLTVSDGTNSVSANTDIKFLPKRYWGVSANPELTDTQIKALSQELSDNRKQTRTFNCSGGKYFYFAIRSDLCSNIMFKVGGLSFSALEVITRDFTNASGHTAKYNIYRPLDIQTGSAILVEVS